MIARLLHRIAVPVLALVCLLGDAHATIHRDDLERMFDEPYVLGEIQADMPVYPLFIKNPQAPDSKPELKGYVFETNDFSVVRGYSGKQINLLVTIDLAGTIQTVRLLGHREPLFIRPEANATLGKYATQFEGLTLRHRIEIGKASATPSRDGQNAFLHGVTTGTISAKAISRTVFTAAAAVAAAKLKIVVPESELIRPPDPEPKAQAAWEPPPERPAGPATTTPANTSFVADEVAGPKTGKAAVQGAVQGAVQAPAPATTSGTPTEATVTVAAANDATGKPGSADKAGTAETTGDAGSSTANIESSTGSASPSSIGNADAAAPAANVPEWLAQWQQRRVDIGILLAGLTLLSVALLAQKRFSARASRLRVLRTLYLLFTVGFIGWYAQGQLSIVNVTAAIDSLSTGGDLSFLMNDPITVILWLFVGITLLVWGRGTFCGWLCPFGALQELISLVANAIGLRQRRLRAVLDARLKQLKYALLAMILVSLYVAPAFSDMAIEIEPFKTAISLYFVREWPFVLWAGACLVLSIAVYRGYCRYICPLGAALASVSLLRRWQWIPRRSECGTPCQSCRHRCEYQAIEPSGKIDYQECFQCLDCVSIYQDDDRCLPLIREKKVQRKIIPLQAVRETA